MGINKDFYIESFDLKWQGNTAATVRGLSVDDLAQIIAENQTSVEKMVDVVENHMTKTGGDVDVEDPVAVASVIQQQGNAIIAAVLKQVPDLVAKVIAIAADEPKEYEHVRKWAMPLQIEALAQIARLTFVDAAGFRTFVGNVLGLVQIVRKEPAPALSALRNGG